MSRKRALYCKKELEKMVKQENSYVIVKKFVLKPHLLPNHYLNNIKEGIWATLYQKLKKYESGLDGILLGYSNIKVDCSPAKICGKQAYVALPVQSDCYVFQPFVGCILTGVVKRISPDHIGCAVHKYFNATIPRPEMESFLDWANRHINFNDIITFRVTDLDFTGQIPYIVGELNFENGHNEDLEVHPEPESNKSREQEEIVFKDLLKSQSAPNERYEDEKELSLFSSTQLPDTEPSSFQFLSPIAAPSSTSFTSPTQESESKPARKEKRIGILKMVRSRKEGAKTRDEKSHKRKRKPSKIQIEKEPIHDSSELLRQKILKVTLQNLGMDTSPIT